MKEPQDSGRAVRSRCKTLAHECLDAAQFPDKKGSRHDLINQVFEAIDPAVYDDQSNVDGYFEWARDVTYRFISEFLTSMGGDCSGHADYSYWCGEQRSFQAA